MFPNNQSCNPLRRQRGAALIVAIFIIVIMATLATIIARVMATAESASVDEVFGARAYHAATSGAQLLVTDLMDAFTTSSGEPGNVCNAGKPMHAFDSPGLKQCHAQVNCTVQKFDDFDIVQYQITSTGQCQSAQQSYSRILSLEVVDGQF